MSLKIEHDNETEVIFIKEDDKTLVLDIETAKRLNGILKQVELLVTYSSNSIEQNIESIGESIVIKVHIRNNNHFELILASLKDSLLICRHSDFEEIQEFHYKLNSEINFICEYKTKHDFGLRVENLEKKFEEIENKVVKLTQKIEEDIDITQSIKDLKEIINFIKNK